MRKSFLILFLSFLTGMASFLTSVLAMDDPEPAAAPPHIHLPQQAPEERAEAPKSLQEVLPLDPKYAAFAEFMALRRKGLTLDNQLVNVLTREEGKRANLIKAEIAEAERAGMLPDFAHIFQRVDSIEIIDMDRQLAEIQTEMRAIFTLHRDLWAENSLIQVYLLDYFLAGALPSLNELTTYEDVIGHLDAGTLPSLNELTTYEDVIGHLHAGMNLRTAIEEVRKNLMNHVIWATPIGRLYLLEKELVGLIHQSKILAHQANGVPGAPNHPIEHLISSRMEMLSLLDANEEARETLIKDIMLTRAQNQKSLLHLCADILLEVTGGTQND